MCWSVYHLFPLLECMLHRERPFLPFSLLYPQAFQPRGYSRRSSNNCCMNIRHIHHELSAQQAYRHHWSESVTSGDSSASLCLSLAWRVIFSSCTCIQQAQPHSPAGSLMFPRLPEKLINSRIEVMMLCPLQKWHDKSFKGLINFSSVTQLLRDGDVIQTHGWEYFNSLLSSDPYTHEYLYFGGFIASFLRLHLILCL